ncbi:MAG: hypothetical protein WD673_08215 [Alphaproteobacteria bacterium]
MRPLVECLQDMEVDVRFVEETPPGLIVGAAIDRLARGAEPIRLLAAAAIAVSRSTELPPDHHGGPVHPVCGLHPVLALSRRLGGRDSWVPIVQSVALANRHVHSDTMGPTAMAALEPLAVTADDAGKADVLDALWTRKPLAAERLLLGGLRSLPSGEVLDLLLDVGVPRNALDDHYFLYPVYAARALDALGWDWAPVVLRPCVRYLAGNPLLDTPGRAGTYDSYYAANLAAYRTFPAIDALIDEQGLDRADRRIETGADEATSIGRLGEAIGSLDDYEAVPRTVAEAMGRGLSLHGAAEALSYGAGLLSLRSNSGNLFNSHFHTGINARRWLLARDGIGRRTRLRALLSWSQGPEVRLMRDTMVWPATATGETLAALPDQAPALRAALEASIRAAPVLDLDSKPDPNHFHLPEDVQTVMALAQRHESRGFDAAPIFADLARLTATDDASEMHAYKLQQAAYEEYQATRAPFRWVHLASAAKHAFCCFSFRPHAVFDQAREFIAAE